MMATFNQWEVVGGKNAKKTKKSNQQNKKSQKNQVKSFIDNMPTLKEKAPVQETPTIFEAFLQKERDDESKKQGNRESVKPKSSQENQSSKKGNQQKNRKQQMKNDDKHAVSVEEAVSKMSIDELSSVVLVTQEKFPSLPLVWLKDLVMYLNVKLEAHLQDPVFSGKPVDYPLSCIPNSTQSLMWDLFGRCPPAVLELFFEYLVSNCIDETVKGLPTLGYRVVIQSLATYMPSITVKNLQKFKDLRTKHQHHPAICLILLWALGQGGFKDFACGLKVWLELMLPLLAMKPYSQYVIDYLEVLFSRHSDVRACNEVMGIREFFPVMDIIFSHMANLPIHLHKQLLALYPKLKTAAFGPNPEHVLRNYFPSLLVRLVPSAPLLLKNELQASLLSCLALDHQCFSVWRQLYTKHLLSSSLLLEHLLNEWESLSTGIPKKLFRTTLETFVVTNDELRVNYANTVGFQKSELACEGLLRKMSMAAMFPWQLLLLLCISIVGGLFAYDVHAAGGFHSSITGRMLTDIGAIAAWHHGCQKIQIYSVKFLDWSRENIPVYFSQLCDFCDPYVQMFWGQLYSLSVFLVDQSAEFREYLNKKVPQFLQWVSDHLPHLMEQQWVVVWNAGEWAWQACRILAEYLVYVCHHTATWLQENVNTGKFSAENIQRFTVDALEYVQQYAIAVYQWMNQQIAGVTLTN